MHKIAALGEVLLDLFPTGAKFGGAPANFAWYCHQLGAESMIVSAIGQDVNGNRVLRELKQMDMSDQYVVKLEKGATGTVQVLFNAGAVPTYDIIEDVAWDHIPMTDDLRELAKTVDAVCFGSLAQRSQTSRKTIHEFLSNTREDCLKIFDINLRQEYYNQEIINRSLSSADIFKVSEEELPAMLQVVELRLETEAACKALLEKYNLRLVALTKGAEGSTLFTRDGQTFSHTGFSDRPIINTVGAGDSFTAVLCLGVLNNVDLAAVNQEANRVAGFVCSYDSATATLPPDIMRSLKSSGII